MNKICKNKKLIYLIQKENTCTFTGTFMFGLFNVWYDGEDPLAKFMTPIFFITTCTRTYTMYL